MATSSGSFARASGDEPRQGSAGTGEVEYAGRHWAIGREEVVPGSI